MNYRADIQILRGIAVTMVLLFHFGFTSFQSGFLGVDVFFVISGFLMAKLYKEGHKKDFYIRRAKRLLPAYFATIIATLFIAATITVPSDFSQVKEQSFFALFYSSNIGFWLQNSYFSKAEFNPLLHLWSLGVEIQFYLIVPLIAMIYKRSKTLFGLALVTSLGLCFLVVTISPKTSFFMMPLRAWEFLLGFGVAKLAIAPYSSVEKYRFLKIVSIILLTGIPFIPVEGQSLSIISGHPASSALIITLVTAMVLTIGFPQPFTQSFIGKALEKIGDYSYSIYLVHFPVIVFFNYEPFGGTILTAETATPLLLQIALVGVLSAISYQVTEKRRVENISLLTALGTTTVIFLGFVGGTFQNYKFTTEQLEIFAAWEDRAPYRCGKVFRILNPNERVCSVTENPPESLDAILLVGNSHADSIKTVFAQVARSLGYETFFYVSNKPLIEGSSIKATTVISDAKALDVKNIILHFSPNKINKQEIMELASQSRKSGITVTFIAPVPTYTKHIPKALYYKTIGKHEKFKQTVADYERSNSEVLLPLRNFFAHRFIEVAESLCTPDCQVKEENGKPLYFDEGHLTITGASTLTSVFERALTL